MAARAGKKWKRVVLSIPDKLKVIEMLDKSTSYTVITEKFGTGRSTVGDIKKNREKILKFSKEMKDMGMSRSAKVMKLGDDSKLDKAVYLSFKQKRMEGVPISLDCRVGGWATSHVIPLAPCNWGCAIHVVTNWTNWCHSATVCNAIQWQNCS